MTNNKNTTEKDVIRACQELIRRDKEFLLSITESQYNVVSVEGRYYKKRKRDNLPGHPDAILSYAYNKYINFSIYVEFKSDKGKLNLNQVLFHKSLKDSNLAVYVVSSVSQFKELIDLLKKEKNKLF